MSVPDAPSATAVGFLVRPLLGIEEIHSGDDLAEMVARAMATSELRLTDGDIVVVASKVVSKAEGRVRRGLDRDAAVSAETVRVVAERGRTRIVQTRHGFVMAAAGVDESNVEPGSVVLLPLDPDGSARALRAELTRRSGARIGVVITDTFGRPWRLGQTDLAIGAAGVSVLDEFGGQVDAYGNPLVVTAPALADELAAAADLAKPKLSGLPVAVVSGLGRLVTADDGPGVAVQVRSADEDMFRLGTRESIASAARLRRGDARLADQDVDVTRIEQLIAEVIAAADHSLDETAGAVPESVGESPAATSDRGWALSRWRDPDHQAWARRILAMESSMPYLLAVTIGHPTGARPSTLLRLGALLDRLALALTADGFGVRQATDRELRSLTESSSDTLVALLAVGIPEPSANQPKNDQMDR